MPRWLPGRLSNRLETRRVVRREVEYGYSDATERHYNQLGHRGLFGRFVVLDEEEIPGDIIVTGWDGGNVWRSKFRNWIPRARGGDAEAFTS